MQKTFPTLPGGWQVVDKLGAGASGTVYRVIRETTGLIEWAAVKHISIPKDEDELMEIVSNPAIHTDHGVQTYIDEMKDTLVKEYSQMLQLRGHTNIVTCFDIQIVPKQDFPGYDIYLWMELLTALSKRIKGRGMNREGTIQLGIDLCNALTQLARKQLVHRDVKPQNIFLNEDGVYKLGDFGTTRILRGTSSIMTAKGTPDYMPPEIVMDRKANFTADIYSLGLVLYVLMNGNCLPFINPEEEVTPGKLDAAGVKRISGQKLPPPAYADPKLARIILKACEHNPRKRWRSAEEMKAALEKLQKQRIPKKRKGLLILPLVLMLGVGSYFLYKEKGEALQAAAIKLASQVEAEVDLLQRRAKNLEAEYDKKAGAITLTWEGEAKVWEIRYGHSDGQYVFLKTTNTAITLQNVVAERNYRIFVYPVGATYKHLCSTKTTCSTQTTTGSAVHRYYDKKTGILTLKWQGKEDQWIVRYGLPGIRYSHSVMPPTTKNQAEILGLVSGRTYEFFIYPADKEYDDASCYQFEYTVPKQ